MEYAFSAKEIRARRLYMNTFLYAIGVQAKLLKKREKLKDHRQDSDQSQKD